MSDRYKPLFAIKPYGYSPGVPVLIYAGNLLWDNFTNRPCVQLKFQSISPKVIQSIRVEIVSKDFNGEIVETATHVYSQLNVARDQFFGDQEVVPLNDTSSTSFSASVVEAVLYDGTVLIPDDYSIKQLPALQPLRAVLGGDIELEKQFQKENGKNHVYAPSIVSDIWRCSCGAINNEKEKACHICRIPAESDLYPDLGKLKERCIARKKAETEARNKIKKKAKLVTITATSIIASVLLIAAVVYFLIIPSSRYKQATSDYLAGNFRDAYSLFEKNGSFKDSVAKAEDSKQKFWTSEYKRILTEGYQMGPDQGGVLSKAEVADKSTLFGLAYIDNDDIPELLVSPYGEFCYIFTIRETEGFLGDAYMANSFLSLNTDDNYEIGYFERAGYVYDRHSGFDDGSGYENELWAPLDEYAGDDSAIFSKHTDRYVYFDDITEYTITWGNASEDYYDEDSFYELLGQNINLDTYKVFELFRNTEKNRKAQLNDVEKNA